jgi:hypothetical protein
MPPPERIHSKLLTEAARTILGPVGLVQLGRSRTWLDDNGWWLCVVEFQPSDWSRGSYLNVGCNWLWNEKDSLSFDVGYRVVSFARFEDGNQFELIAVTLAERAAEEVKRYRALFRTVRSVSDHYLRNEPNGFWPTLHAAIACGMAGRSAPAREFFESVLVFDDNRDWTLAAKKEASRLYSLVDDERAFRHTVMETVVRTRQLFKLPARRILTFDGLA